ncbi:MAG TPA: STM3941 family protein, partial [Puia sp.]|nr:STM3941 family protein [Puia sp.]
MPTTETIIPFSKGKLSRLLLLAVGCILLGIVFVIIQSHEPGVFLTLPILAALIGAFLLLVAFLLGTIYFRQILKNGPGLVIDITGFTDYSSSLAAGYIPWTDVKAIKTITLPKDKQKYISV